MSYVVISNYCSSNVYKNVIPQNYRSNQQYQKYMRLFCEGLIKNSQAVDVISIPPITRRNSIRRRIKLSSDVENHINFSYVTIYNVVLLRYFITFFQIIIKIIKYSKNNNIDYIVLDILNPTSFLAGYLSAKLTRKKTIGILTDLPKIYVGNEGSRLTFPQKVSTKLSNLPDIYLFVSEEMNKVVNFRNKPYIVLEGFADIQMKNRVQQKKNIPRVIMYAGGINVLYGIDMLVYGFLEAQLDNCELHIYGSGPFESDLREVCKTYMNVKFYGIIDNNDILELEEKATLLVNPRYTDEEYTKYSFPSKNIEYISTGTPILTTKLASMPAEYYDYIYILENESKSGMADKLSDIMMSDAEQLICFGAKAKNWIIEQKNNVMQISKLLGILHNELG